MGVPASAVTVTQAAKILGKSRWTVLRMIKTGELLGEKLDGSTTPWLLSRADVERLARRELERSLTP